MSATLVPFPCDRLAGRVRRVAAMIYDGSFPGRFPNRSAAHATAYDRRVKADLRKAMKRAGIAEYAIRLELLAFTRANDNEFRRLCREGHIRGRSRASSPSDGDDAA